MEKEKEKTKVSDQEGLSMMTSGGGIEKKRVKKRITKRTCLAQPCVLLGCDQLSILKKTPVSFLPSLISAQVASVLYLFLLSLCFFYNFQPPTTSSNVAHSLFSSFTSHEMALPLAVLLQLPPQRCLLHPKASSLSETPASWPLQE